jgi:hypothetical protein
MTSIVLSFQSLKRLIQKTRSGSKMAAPPLMSLSCLSRQLGRCDPPNPGFVSPQKTAPVAEGEWLRAADRPRPKTFT